MREQNQLIESQNEGQLRKISQLEQLKVKYCGLSDRQGLIIEELEGLRPSTYQNILLEQAKTIEMMMGQGVGNAGWETRNTPVQATLALQGQNNAIS